MKNSLYVIRCCMFSSCTKEHAPIDKMAFTTDFLGELEWIKNYGGSGQETAHSIIVTSDGGYAVFGFSNSMDGDSVWQSTFGGTNLE